LFAPFEIAYIVTRLNNCNQKYHKIKTLNSGMNRFAISSSMYYIDFSTRINNDEVLLRFTGKKATGSSNYPYSSMYYVDFSTRINNGEVLLRFIGKKARFNYTWQRLLLQSFQKMAI